MSGVLTTLCQLYEAETLAAIPETGPAFAPRVPSEDIYTPMLTGAVMMPTAASQATPPGDFGTIASSGATAASHPSTPALIPTFGSLDPAKR